MSLRMSQVLPDFANSRIRSLSHILTRESSSEERELRTRRKRCRILGAEGANVEP